MLQFGCGTRTSGISGSASSTTFGSAALQLGLCRFRCRVAAQRAGVRPRSPGRVPLRDDGCVRCVRGGRPLRNPLLAAELGSGEAAAIAIAFAIGARLLLDDRKARRIATAAYRLRVMGSAGPLVNAKRAGFRAGSAPLARRDGCSRLLPVAATRRGGDDGSRRAMTGERSSRAMNRPAVAGKPS